MNFKKDLLLIDIEATGLDVSKHDIIQLAAILLDKNTLKEKQSFCTYIKPKNWQAKNKASMKVNKITWEDLANAPELKQVLKKFNKTFGKKIVLSYYVGIMDIIFLQKAYTNCGIKWPFDYHYFNIWPLFYGYLAKHNLLDSKKDFAGFNIKKLIKKFNIKIKKNQLHDALVDCRVEAEVLRRILQLI